MKTVIKILSVCLAAAVLLSTSLCTSAKSLEARLVTDKCRYEIGDTVKVTLDFKTDFSFYFLLSSLHFDQTIFECTDVGEGHLSGDEVIFALDMSGETEKSLTVYFTVIGEGATYFSFNCECSDGTENRKYAAAENVRAYCGCDLDGDGKTDINDAEILADIIVGNVSPPFSAVKADFNGDGAVDVLDCLKILLK